MTKVTFSQKIGYLPIPTHKTDLSNQKAVKGYHMLSLRNIQSQSNACFHTAALEYPLTGYLPPFTYIRL